MQIETERLKLIPFEDADLSLLHQTFADPFVRRYLWDDETISIDTANEILQTSITHFEDDDWGLWKVYLKDRAIFVGFAGLWQFFEEKQPQLLYGLLPQHTRQGYAREASQAIVDYSFKKLGFKYVTASFDAEHLPSEKVCKHLNMQLHKEEEINGKKIVFYTVSRGI